VSAVYAKALGARDLQPTSPFTAITLAFGAWMGPSGVTFDMSGSGLPVNFYYEPAGASIGAVVDYFTGRAQNAWTYWLDPDLVFHLWPGPHNWDSSYSPGSYQIAPFSLTALPTSGGVVPTTLVDSYDASSMRSGAFGTGSVPSANTSSSTGRIYAGWEMTSAPSVHTTGVGEAIGAALAGKHGWRRTMSATLPAGAPAPGIATYLRIDYPPITTDPEYVCVRAVRGELKVPGEGSGGMEWTLDLGDIERRSFVYEETLGQGASQQTAAQVVQVGCDPVSDMGPDSMQVIRAWGEDAYGNRVRLDGGSFNWRIHLNSVDIGEGGVAAGWWLTATSTPIMWMPAMPLGFSYCLLNCEPGAPGAVKVTAELVT
jgi:hypothetical protein